MPLSRVCSKALAARLSIATSPLENKDELHTKSGDMIDTNVRVYNDQVEGFSRRPKHNIFG